ncbi:MAG: ABC transporter ATP-binding protein [Hadesarchaea archaeon]|nr:ABC transporter ATP-binding protein [Hadesarchaea archaeon]
MTEPILKLENVSRIINGEKILENVTWEVQEDENWILLGPNGAGKTTLMKIVTGYLWPTEGEVTVLGKKFGRIDLRELRKSIGYVDSNILRKFPNTDSALKVVLSGKFATLGLYDKPTERDRAQARRVLSRMGCSELEEREFGNLSQGEKQKIMIARALMAEPGLLVLDEPALGLDPGARERFLEILENINEMKNDPNLIYITQHIQEITPSFKKGLILKDGRILAKGRLKKILNDEVLSVAFGVNMEVIRKNDRYTISHDEV